MIIEIKVEGKRGRREGEIFFLIEEKKKEGRRQLGRKIVVTITETR